MTADLDRAELRTVAEAAYWDGYTWRPEPNIVARADTDVAVCTYAQDAAFIAACDPPTILALLDDLDRMEAGRDEALGKVSAGLALADEWDHRYDSGDHMLGCTDGSAYYDILANEIRAALGGGDAGKGWECDVCGCWNPDGSACKYGDDEAHKDAGEGGT